MPKQEQVLIQPEQQAPATSPSAEALKPFLSEDGRLPEHLTAERLNVLKPILNSDSKRKRIITESEAFYGVNTDGPVLKQVDELRARVLETRSSANPPLSKKEARNMVQEMLLHEGVIPKPNTAGMSKKEKRAALEDVAERRAKFAKLLLEPKSEFKASRKDLVLFEQARFIEATTVSRVERLKRWLGISSIDNSEEYQLGRRGLESRRKDLEKQWSKDNKQKSLAGKLAKLELSTDVLANTAAYFDAKYEYNKPLNQGEKAEPETKDDMLRKRGRAQKAATKMFKQLDFAKEERAEHGDSILKLLMARPEERAAAFEQLRKLELLKSLNSRDLADKKIIVELWNKQFYKPVKKINPLFPFVVEDFEGATNSDKADKKKSKETVKPTDKPRRVKRTIGRLALGRNKAAAHEDTPDKKTKSKKNKSKNDKSGKKSTDKVAVKPDKAKAKKVKSTDKPKPAPKPEAERPIISGSKEEEPAAENPVHSIEHGLSRSDKLALGTIAAGAVVLIARSLIEGRRTRLF